MKEIIGDDYPTYEDSVNMTLAERQRTWQVAQEEYSLLKHRLLASKVILELLLDISKIIAMKFLINQVSMRMEVYMQMKHGTMLAT